MKLTFNEWVEAPKFMNGHAENLLEDCVMIATKFSKKGRSAELRAILRDLGYERVSSMKGKTADLKAFYRRVSALPFYKLPKINIL